MDDLDQVYDTFRMIGEDPAQILTPDTPYVVAHGHEVVGLNTVPGVIMIPQRVKQSIQLRVTVLDDHRVEAPVHLCFGLFGQFEVQNVHLQLTMQPNSSATFWSHCLFTTPEAARHAMNANVDIQEGAALNHNEVHYHGLSGGVEVIPRAKVAVGSGAQYRADFSLVQGRVGKLDIDYTVEVGTHAIAELTSKVHGHITDEIRIREEIHLNGEAARGLVKSRVAVEDDARAEIIGATYGNAPYARGHVDCMEIVRGRAVATAEPRVRVSHPQAKVTHEAAIGSVDQKQLETLMARGLAPDEAVDVIVRGLLR